MTTMKISKLISDDGILTEIGERISRRRLEQSLTQAQLAEQSGVSKRTVERIEAGASTQVSSLIRIFRVLNLLPAFNQMIPEVAPEPIDILRHKGKTRQRASTRKQSKQMKKEWSWDDKT